MVATVASSIARDLLNKLSSVTAFGTPSRVGFTLGGTEADPTNAELPTPYAWALLQGSQNLDTERQGWQRIQMNFIVYLGMTYGDGEDDFVDTQLTLIEEVATAVGGTTVSVPGPGRWSYDGATFLDGQPNRVIYALQFSCVAHYQQ